MFNAPAFFALCAIAVSAATVCDDGSTTVAVHAAVGGEDSSEESLRDKGCPADGDEQSCICAAFRLGWRDTAQSLLRTRLQRKVDDLTTRWCTRLYSTLVSRVHWCAVTELLLSS